MTLSWRWISDLLRFSLLLVRLPPHAMMIWLDFWPPFINHIPIEYIGKVGTHSQTCSSNRGSAISARGLWHFPLTLNIIQHAMTSITSWASCKSSFSRWRRCLSSSCFWYQESDLRSVDVDIRVLPVKIPPLRRPAARWALASHEHPVVTWVEVVLSAWKTA